MIAKLFTSLALIVTLLFQNAAVMPARHADDIQLKAVLVSDIHSDADFTRDRTNLMREVFAAVGGTQRDADTIVMSGDLTNSGDLREYINLFNCLNFYCRIRDRVPEIGNHDSWHHSDDPDWRKAEKYFKWFCSWNGINTDKVYYKKEVNGIPFIVLGVEAGDFKNPYHSPEQLNWFEEELNSAVGAGTPVFVICHKPPEDLCDSADRIRQILNDAAGKATAPIIYVSGHYHEIGENTFARPQNNLVFLNLPSMLYTDDGGLGFIAEIREGELTLTCMNFLKNTPLEEYCYKIEY
ncbi:MAG: metallophosphoesterase [Clostridia bacterium]|nr:metallophosphoesterase [Clostridia bacterium]